MSVTIAWRPSLATTIEVAPQALQLSRACHGLAGARRAHSSTEGEGWWAGLGFRGYREYIRVSYRENGKENGNYYLGFWCFLGLGVIGLGFTV